jgi:hypothetical protein
MIIRIFVVFVTMILLVCHDLCTWQTARSQRGCERLYYMIAWRTHLGMRFKPAFHITNVGMYTQPSSFKLQASRIRTGKVVYNQSPLISAYVLFKCR